MKLRILVISDVHGSERGLNRVKASIIKYDPELVCICGDITHFGDKNEAFNLLSKIKSKIIGITGNCDPRDVQEAYKNVGGEYIDLSIYNNKGFNFLGLSGSNYYDEKIEKFKVLSQKADIFVFHSPPYGYLDENSRGKHIGERSLLPIIKKHPPELILSGHVHESRGIIKEKGTTYLNPGPLLDDQLALVDICKEGDVEAELL